MNLVVTYINPGNVKVLQQNIENVFEQLLAEAEQLEKKAASSREPIRNIVDESISEEEKKLL